MIFDRNLMFLGDIHGSISWFTYILNICRSWDIKTIIQAGDFGYYPRLPYGEKFLRMIAKSLIDDDITMIVVPGNHEDWHSILYTDHKYDDEGFILPIANQTSLLKMIYPGLVWTWCDLRFTGLGGAWSVNREEMEADEPAPYMLYFPEEVISESDLYKMSEIEGDVDIFVSHDSPWGVNIPTIYNEFPESNNNRRALATAVDMVNPKLLVHGHYHIRYNGFYKSPEGQLMPVVGLNKNGTGPDNYYTLFM